ncbi:MAG: PAS domain S-box protein, partial [Deltaproteobacteria bacterium]|nr:PAS domain S-box protein [Deltaproteobacteria bacterium]
MDWDRPRLKLFVSVTRAISEADTYQEAIQAALKEVCEATGWNIGEAWFPTPDGKALRCGPACYSRTKTLENFKLLCEGMAFPPGIGLPGRVWMSKQPEWIHDMSLAPDNAYPRAKIAKRLGLKAALGVPIIANDEVLAVLGFHMQEPREENKHLVEDVSAVATQLGWVIQHKQAEEALRESDRRFHAIFDQTFEFVGLLSPDGTVLEANQTALKFRGLKRADVVGRPFWETAWWDFSLETRERLKAAVAEAAQGKFIRYETAHRDRDGVVGTFDFSLKPVTDDDGKVVLIIPEGRNITARKQAEQELRDSEERYRELVELSPDAIFLNHEGRFFFVNSAALELFGATSPDQLIGKPIMDVIHPDYRELVAERIRHMMERWEKTPLIEQKNIRLDGTEFDVEVTAAPLIYQGKPMVQVVARDVTERKRAE